MEAGNAAQSGAAGPPTNTLLFVQIPTHFREMIRAAELLQDAPGFSPIVLFMANYAGVKEDIRRCTDRGIRVIAADDLYTYLPRPPAPRRFAVLAAVAAAARYVRERVALARELSAVTARAIAAPARRAAARAASWMAAATPRPVRPHVAGVLRAARAMRRELGIASSELRDVARRLAAGLKSLVALGRRTLGVDVGASISRAGRDALRRLAKWSAPHVRRVLMYRIPSLANARWLQRLSAPVRGAIVMLAGTVAKTLWILAIPLLPLIRRAFTAAFAIAYRRAPDSLPPDIRAQHYVWRIVPRLLEENSIDLVLLPEDNFYYFTNLFVKGIHARGGKAVIVPFTIVNVLEWAEAFKSLPSHDAEILMNRIVAMLFPQWCYRHKGKLMVMPPQQVLSNEALGVAPPIPWLINSGRADAIAAESLFMARYYRRAGIPEAKIRFTGALADDVLHRTLVEAESRRAALYRELALPSERPMILCALPPNQLAGDGRPLCQFGDYLELLAAFVEPLERLADEYNIVVSLHPRITPAQARVLEGRRLRVSRHSVAELIPLSCIYVACCSATIRLAISCGVPVVNYDVFVYDYDDFKQVPGVVTLERQEEYVAAIERLAREPGHYARLRELQLEFAREQAILDGKAGQRLLELFESLMPSRASA